MGWKIFAIISTVVLLDGILRYPIRDVIEMASIPINFIATLGLVAYAFHIDRLKSRYWTVIAWAFAAWCVFAVGVGVFRSSTGGISTSGIVGGSLLAFALTFPNWVALRRLGHAAHA